MDDAVDQRKTHHENGRDHVVHAGVVAQINQAEQATPGHALNAVFGVGKGRLHADKVHHLGQRQGHHGKVNALPPHCQPAGYQPDAGGRRRAGQDGQLRAQAPDLGRMGRDVGGEAEEHRMAK